MGWRGTIRAIEAGARRAEREAERQRKHAAVAAKKWAKYQAQEAAIAEVKAYESLIERFLSLHKDTPEEWDWVAIRETPAPVVPERQYLRMAKARYKLDSFKPSFLDKILGRAESQYNALVDAVAVAQVQDEQEYDNLYRAFCKKYIDWSEGSQMASNIINGDLQAYSKILSDINPLSYLKDLIVDHGFRVLHSNLVEVCVTVAGEVVIPVGIKSLTATGKVSEKPMPKSRFFEIYGEFVCGLVLRVGREVAALLPVETTMVQVQADILNPKTGHHGIETLLSVRITRSTLLALNFEALDPIDAMGNFEHRMQFSRSSGFSPIVPVTEAPQRTTFPVHILGNTPPKLPDQSGMISLEQLLTQYPANEGYHWIPVLKIAASFNIAAEAKLAIPVCRQICERVDQAGYCVEPDVRYGGGTFAGDQFVAIFKPAESEPVRPSLAYFGAAALLRLCILVGTADGEMDQVEIDVFRAAVEAQLELSVTDHKRLAALESLLLTDNSSAKTSLARIAKFAPQHSRRMIARVLVEVAAADNVISKDEYVALERIFEALNLKPGTLQTIVREISPAVSEVKIQERENSTVIPLKIPSATKSSKSPNFVLDMARVNAIAAESREVVEMLAAAMQEEDESSSVQSSARSAEPPGMEAKPVARNDSVHITGFAELDASLRPVVAKFSTRESMTRVEFNALAQEFRLMPLALYDAVNEWADEHLGDFLLEGEDPVIIRRELLTPVEK